MNKVVIDTSVWSLAFRRKHRSESEEQIVAELAALVQAERTVVIGAVRQELLTGMSDMAAFLKLKRNFSPFPDISVLTIDYENAAAFSNICRKHGIQGSQVDFLICAVAVRNNWQIFTTDKDFEQYHKHLPIELFDYHQA